MHMPLSLSFLGNQLCKQSFARLSWEIKLLQLVSFYMSFFGQLFVRRLEPIGKMDKILNIVKRRNLVFLHIFHCVHMSFSLVAETFKAIFALPLQGCIFVTTLFWSWLSIYSYQLPCSLSALSFDHIKFFLNHKNVQNLHAPSLLELKLQRLKTYSVKSHYFDITIWYMSACILPRVS